MPKMNDSYRRSAPISCSLDACENAPYTKEYASAFRKHQSIKILAQLIRQNRSSWAMENWVDSSDGGRDGAQDLDC